MGDFPKETSTSENLLSVDLERFFSQLVFETAEELKAQLSDPALHYTSQVLVDFVESRKFFSSDSVRLPILADLLSEALEADFYRRVSLLRRLGDTSLMISGYFPEAVARRSVSLTYYAQMGETAYSELGRITEAGNVFDELSAEFGRLAEVLTHMTTKLKTRGMQLRDLLSQYEISQKNELLEQLRLRGIYPFPSKPEGSL